MGWRAPFNTWSSIYKNIYVTWIYSIWGCMWIRKIYMIYVIKDAYVYLCITNNILIHILPWPLQIFRKFEVISVRSCRGSLARRLQVLSHRVAGSNGDAITHFCASNGMDLSDLVINAHLVGEFAAFTHNLPWMEGTVFPIWKVGSHPMIVLFGLLVIAVSGVSFGKNSDWLCLWTTTLNRHPW